MRAWLLTNTTYGSHLPGDRRGSITSVRDLRPNDPPTTVRIEHNIPGETCEDEIPGLRAAASEQMIGPAIYFDLEKASIVLAQFRETAMHRGWVLRAVAIMPDHFHIVLQVPHDPDPRKMLADFKAYGSRALSRKYGKPSSKTWWTTNGSKRKLNDDKALAAAQHYVLKKQPNPLIVWHPNIGTDGCQA